MNQFLPESFTTWLPDAIQIIYLVATAFFIRGIKLLGSPATARKDDMHHRGYARNIYLFIFSKYE